MPLGPDELIEYFKVRYRIVADIEDSSDPDDEPDRLPVNGYVIFTPNLDKNSPVVKYPTGTDDDDEPLGFELAPLRRKIKVVNGRLSHNDTGYVKLEANSEYANPPVWSWHVDFDLSTAQGKVNRAGFDIAAEPDTIVDLTIVSPVSGGVGQQIIQGPRGYGIDDADIVGDQLVLSLDDPSNTSLPPVTIPSVSAAAEAAEDSEASAAASAASAAAAASSASAASGSASAASASAATALSHVNSFGLAIGTVNTGAPGSSASASVTGGPPGYTLGLTIPRGDPGASAVDADATTKGILRLAGDLAGTATSPAIANGAVTAAKIANDTITGAQIAADAIGSSELADNAVDTNALANNAVTAAKIANDTITATQIAANAVGSSELADNAVDTNAIQDDAVTSAKIAAGTIVNSDISSSAAIAAGKTLVPASFIFIVNSATRAAGTGDLINGVPFFDGFVIDSATWFFGTADASGSTVVKLQRNRAGTTVDVAGSDKTISAANQVDGTATDTARTTAIADATGIIQSGDRLIPTCVSTGGTTPGQMLGVYIKGHWS